MKKTPSIFTVISIIALALIAVGCAQIKVATPPAENTPDKDQNQSPIACTMDAKICPDGSAVGRSGPTCEFAPCPASTTESATDSTPVTNSATAATTNPKPVTLANPASQNCSQQGGKLEMRNNKQGQYGVCLFEDNRQCEEWALLRGDCPAGGLKITGYENDAQIYCAITGGTVENVGMGTPMCRRTDGTLCTAQANFDGQCPNPNDPNPNAGNVEAE